MSVVNVLGSHSRRLTYSLTRISARPVGNVFQPVEGRSFVWWICLFTSTLKSTDLMPAQAARNASKHASMEPSAQSVSNLLIVPKESSSNNRVYFLRNSLGVKPQCFLNIRVKYSGYSKPRRSEASVIVFLSFRQAVAINTLQSSDFVIRYYIFINFSVYRATVYHRHTRTSHSQRDKVARCVLPSLNASNRFFSIEKSPSDFII